MRLCGSLSVQHIFHVLLVGVIFGLQLRQQLEVDKTLTNLPDISSAVSMASLAIVFLLHVIRVVQTMRNDNDKGENAAMKVARNFLGGSALVFEFISMGLRDGSLEGDSLTIAGIILGCLCLLRILDTFQDYEDPWETVSVQCIDGMVDQPDSGMLRLVLIHLFIAVAIVLDVVSLVRAEDGTHPWANGDDESVRTLSIVTLSLMILHFILYPGNALLRASGLDQAFLSCSAFNCLCPNRKRQPLANCPEENPMNRQMNSALEGKQKVLVSISRLPLIRQLVSTTILVGLSYVGGATHGKQETQFRIGALVAYSAYEIIGRNKL